MAETEGQLLTAEALKEELCTCGHTAGSHADPLQKWEQGEQTTGECREENCECPQFEEFEEQAGAPA